MPITFTDAPWMQTPRVGSSVSVDRVGNESNRSEISWSSRVRGTIASGNRGTEGKI